MSLRNPRSAIPDSNDLFSEASFRRFEDDIRLIARTYPSPITLRPQSLKLATYTTRLRSSMNAYINSTWASDISREIVFEIRKEFEFQPDLITRSLYIGPRKSHKVQGAVADMQGMKVDAIIDASEYEIIHALCVLKNRNLIEGVVSVKNLGADIAFSLLEQFPNVAIARNADSTANVL